MEVTATLGVVDYIICGVVLLVSLSIGVFYGCTGGKQKTTEEFLVADRNMPVIPVAMSLLASFMSTVTVLGTPAEVYRFGTLFLMLWLGFLIMAPTVAFAFHPVFFKLRITSVFEYLELRFCKGVRIFGAVLYIIQMTLYMSIVLYGPALAINAVTGFNIWIIVLSAGCVCTIYTTLGGMKAVMWTDTFQVVMMLAGLLAVLIKGVVDQGGVKEVWDINYRAQRIEFLNFNPNPFVRHTTWNLMFGGAMLWISIFGTNQAQVQRIVSCPTLRHAQLATFLNLPGLCIVTGLSGLCGLVVYVRYRDCDPISTKRITAVDQLLPLYVMEEFHDIPGFAGLVISCILCAAISTFSSGLNSLAAVSLQDICKQFNFFKGMTDEKTAIVSKILALVFGVVSIALCFVVSLYGTILTAAYSLFGMIAGPVLGVFMLGMFYPCANYKGAYCGLIVGLAVTVWLGIGARLHPPDAPLAPMSTAGCALEGNYTSNMTTMMSTVTMMPPDFTTITPAPPPENTGFTKIYGLSYMWYTPISVIFVTVVGLVVSFITGATDPADLDRRLLSPLVLKLCCCFEFSPKGRLPNVQSVSYKTPQETYTNKAYEDT